MSKSDVVVDDGVDREDDIPAPATHHAPEGIDPKEIAADWAEDYPEGSELFCGTFDAEDFDTEFGGEEYPDGTTVAVKRCTRRPTPGWVRKHAHMSDLERTFALLELHASDEALDILDSLGEDAWNDFVQAWGQDGGIIPKSSRSARRSKRSKTR